MDYSISFLLLSTRNLFLQISKLSYSLVFCGTPPSCLKVIGGWQMGVGCGGGRWEWGVVVAPMILGVSPSPLGTNLGFELV